MCHTITSIDVNNEATINTIETSKKNVTTWNQLKASRVRRIQHVSAHPSNKTIIYSTMTDGIKINAITVRDVKIVLQC